MKNKLASAYDGTLIPGSWIPITEPQVFVGLGWDIKKGEKYDLDASVTSFDISYRPIESIYYMHKVSSDGNIVHQGDNLTGKGKGDDEIIDIKLSKLDSNVNSLAVTVSSYRRNSLINAKEAYIRIYTKKAEIGKYILKRAKDCIALLLGVFSRDPTTLNWYFRVMADPIEGNVVTSSYESLQVLMGEYCFIYDKDKNSGDDEHPLPGERIFVENSWIPIHKINTYVGLGWSISPGHTFDLDASLICFDAHKNVLEIIYHRNTKSKDGQIIHHGDSKTGFGEGDDEIISINFPKINHKITAIAVILNSFKGNFLTGIEGGFIRLFEEKNIPIGCYLLKGKNDCLGLLLGIFRVVEGRWFFQVMIEEINGCEAPEAVEDVKYYMDSYQAKINDDKIETHSTNEGKEKPTIKRSAHSKKK